MSGMRQQILVVLAVFATAGFCEAQSNPHRLAFVAEPLGDADWKRRVAEQQGVLTNQPCRVCFIGDSLTEFWLHTGRATWDLEFGALKPANLGIAGDRTEHILSRIQKLEFWRANASLVVLMMGTNNLGMEPPDAPEDVSRAVVTAVAMLQAKLPKASVLVLGIPPSGNEPESPLRQRIKKTNLMLALQKWPDRVAFQSTYASMVDASDRWREGFTVDGTHFSAAGYAKLGELISPVVKKMLGEDATSKPVAR